MSGLNLLIPSLLTTVMIETTIGLMCEGVFEFEYKKTKEMKNE